MEAKIRESNFELLRIVAMICIVYYHFLLYFVVPVKGVDSVFGAMQIPLHIGVPLFVLISGYFGINPSLQGIRKLIFCTFVYCVPLQLSYDFYISAGAKDLLCDMLFISHGPYWFIRTYILFYLFVPVINVYLANADEKKRWYLLCVLAVINFWFGSISGGDMSLIDGKNLINFTLIYVVGNSIRLYRCAIEKICIRKISALFVALNAVVVGAYYFPHSEISRMVIMRIAFGYNSPILIVNASILFAIFLRFKFKSVSVNRMSASVLAVYLVTEQTVVREHGLGKLADWLMTTCSSDAILACGLLIMTIAIVACCISFDAAISRFFKCCLRQKCIDTGKK